MKPYLARLLSLFLVSVLLMPSLVRSQALDQDQSSITALTGGGSSNALGDTNRSPAQAIVLDDIVFDVTFDRSCVDTSAAPPFSCGAASIISTGSTSAPDICTWAEDYNLTDVSYVGNDSIDLLQNLTSAGLTTQSPFGEPLVGNAWAFLVQDGSWVGGTWEWMRPSQTQKFKDNIEAYFSPEEGQEIYYMVSSLARGAYTDGSGNGRFRTNFVSLPWEGNGAPSCVPVVNNLVEVAFDRESEATLAFDYTGASIVADANGAVSNVIQGESQLLFDIDGADGAASTVTISGLRAYILNGQANDLERLKLTFNEQEYFTDRFTVDTFSEYCTDVGTFAGATGIGGAYKIGDQLSYFPTAPNVGQQYFLDLTALNLAPIHPAGDAVTIPAGNIDMANMTFPLIQQRLSTGEFIATCMTAPITVDNQFSPFTEFGSFSGETGPNTTFRIGDNILYTAPTPIDGDTFTVDYNVIGGSDVNPAGSTYLIPEGNVDVAASSFLVTATDDAGNQVEFPSPVLSLDNIRPIFGNNFITTGPFVSMQIPQSKLDDLRYKGFADQFDVDKSYWGDGDEMTILMPSDDTADGGEPLVTADFTDISSAGTLVDTRDPAELTFTLDRYFDTIYADVSEIVTFIDQSDYTNSIRYTDDAGNDPAEGAITTNEVPIDLIAPQVPASPEYGVLQIVNGNPVAIIGDLLDLVVPLLDIRGEPITYSIDLMEVGGAVAEFFFRSGTTQFGVSSGTLESGEAYNRTVYYFDKAFNLLERTVGEVLVDNEVPMFDQTCGATFTIFQSEGDANGLADVAHLGPDTVHFHSPDASLGPQCDLAFFSIDFGLITGDAVTGKYDRVPADGRILPIIVGEGILDTLAQPFIMTTFDQHGNQKDFITGSVAIDNDVTQPGEIEDKASFASFNTNEEDLYVAVGDLIRISIETPSDDLVSITAALPGAIGPLALEKAADSDVWSATAPIEAGVLVDELVFIEFTIIDNALNRVVVPGKQKIFVRNKPQSNDFGGGGSIDHNRSNINARNEGRARIKSKSIADQARIHNALSQAEQYQKRIEFLQRHGFELGPDEKAFLRERSLSRRLNYIQPSVNPGKRDNLAPSYFDLLKQKFDRSRKKVESTDKTPGKLQQALIDRLLDKREQSKQADVIDDEGGFRMQNTLERLNQRSSSSDVPGTLRKSELLQRGRVGEIKY